ncbi:hypothetical protein I3300191I4_14970 [Megasphaera elsdenii]
MRQQIQTNNIASSNPRLVEKIVARGSWFVKARHYTRMGCGQISQRDALWATPTHKADGRAFLPVAVSFSIAYMRYRRGRLKGVPP